MKPTYQNIPYGPHERNVLDVYKAQSASPSPIFFWIHGGAFQFGDKSERAPSFVAPLFERGISLVATNYRFSHQAIYPAPYHDCRRAFQFVRHHASSWGMDATRIAVGGLSAGAGMSLWLAFRLDMADPSSSDPILRESTKPICVYISDGQTSYDPRFIAKTIGGSAHLSSGLSPLFGVPQDIWPALDEPTKRLVEDASPINFLDDTAPPVFALYSMSRKPAADNDIPEQVIHHPQFGDDLKKRMDVLGLECTVVVDEDLQKGSETAKRRTKNDMGDFLARHLKSIS